MPIQAPQWTEFLSCPVCYNVFNEKQNRPISLACGHTVCKSCLSKLQQRKCPFDQTLISRDIGELPVNFALLQLVCATAVPEAKEQGIPKDCQRHYEAAKSFIEELALLLKPVSSPSTGSIIAPSSTASGSSTSLPNCVLSRPMQRKLITLVNCQLVEEEGRSRAVRAARSLGERTVTELILQHQNPQQLSSNLWAAVRGRGCQFLGPAMQEEVLHLILLALEDGSALSRKVLVLFVVQRLEAQYPQASKTAIGHVVQLLYRASCFKVTKRDQESSLMQLKEEFRSYETLRREHDTQIVQIAMEAGLRIAPDQWSSLLYGDSTHKSHMQSIIDKLQTPQTFGQSVSELLIALQRTGDPHGLQRLQPELEFLSSIDPSPDVPCPTWENLEGVLRAARTVIEGLVTFLQNSGYKKHDFLSPFNNVRYKTSMCRDYSERGSCPRGGSCTFAHSEEELERYRQRNKKASRGVVGLPGGPGERKVGALPAQKLDRGSQEHSEDDADDLVAPFQASNLSGGYPSGSPARPQGPAQGVHGATYIPHGASQNAPRAATPTVVTVAPHSRSQSSQVPSQATPSNPDFNQSAVPQGSAPTPHIGALGQISPQGEYAPQHQVHMGPGQRVQSPGYHMGQVSPQAPYAGQMNPQGKGMPPPMMQPHFDPMGFSGGMMGRGRFPFPPPMNPMMYMYPGMHPYMSYYHPGCMAPGGMRYPNPHYDAYRPQLNPYAEPWSPQSEQKFYRDYMAMTGQAPMDASPQVDCTLCSHLKQQNTVVAAQQNDLHTSGNDLQASALSRSKSDVHASTSTVTWSRTDIQPTNLPRSNADYSAVTSSSVPTSILQRSQADVTTSTSVYPRSHADIQASIYPGSQAELRASTSVVPGSRSNYDLGCGNLPTSTTEFQQSRSNLHDSVTDFGRQGPVSIATVSQVMTTSYTDQAAHKKTTDHHMQKTDPSGRADATIERQSLSTLQERRNSLLAILKERRKTNNKSLGKDLEELAPMKSYQDLVERMKRHTSHLSNITRAEETLKHPVPRDSGPVGLKAADPSHANLFKRLGAISGVPPRSVNDSIMASWMTATLTAASSKNTSNVVTKSNVSILNAPNSGENKNYGSGISSSISHSDYSSSSVSDIISSLPQSTYYKSSSVSDIISSLPQSTYYKSSQNDISRSLPESSFYGSLENDISSSIGQSSYYSSSFMDEENDWNAPSSQYREPATSSVSKSHSQSKESSWNATEDDYPYWKDIARTMDSPSPTLNSIPMMSQRYSDVPHSLVSQFEVHPSITNFFSQLDQEQDDNIPFDPPIISKFGPISRLRTKSNNTVPLKVMADEMMKTIPVTAVTPLSRPPLPNATTVPSRFTHTSAESLDSVSTLLEAGNEPEPEPYSLWKKEVIQLERKAQEASTVDERLKVELQAVEMQISMKQQELQEVHDVQYAQRQASEYIKHRQPMPPDDNNLPDWM